MEGRVRLMVEDRGDLTVAVVALPGREPVDLVRIPRCVADLPDIADAFGDFARLCVVAIVNDAGGKVDSVYRAEGEEARQIQREFKRKG